MNYLFNTDNYSKELIAHQDRSSFKDIEDALDDLRMDVMKFDFTDIDTYTNPAWSVRMRKLLRDRFNIKCHVHVLNNYGFMGVLTPAGHAGNVLATDHERTLFNSDKAPDGKLLKSLRTNPLSSTGSGGISLKKAKVSGDFAKVRNDILIDPVQMFADWGVSTPVATATLLHEVGHILTRFSLYASIRTGNWVMNETFKTRNEDIKQYKIALHDANKTTDMLSDKALKKLDKIDTVVMFKYELLKQITRVNSTSAPMDQYDDTSSEALADAFATRCGYGREFIEFIHELSKSDTKQDTTTFGILFPASIAIASAVAIFFAPVFILTAITGVSAVIREYNRASDRAAPGRYDNYVDRVKRILDQHTDLLKNKSLPKELLPSILKSHAEMEKIYKDTHDSSDFGVSVFQFFNSTAKSAKADKKLQRDLEDLAANKLFVLSARLRV